MVCAMNAIGTSSPPRAVPALIAGLAWLASSCSTARTYPGPGRPESQVARATVSRTILLLAETDRIGRIMAVDGEPVDDLPDAAAYLLLSSSGAASVELLPGEHRIELRLSKGVEVDRRTLRWEARAGVAYSIGCRPSERQPPVEAFVVREDTGEELAVSWIAPPAPAAFGLDPARWRAAEWRVEPDRHWIAFVPAEHASGEARERLRLEWSEPDRWYPAPQAAWALGVDLGRELEREHTDFAWRDVDSGDGTSVHEWSGARGGGARSLHGLVVVQLREGRASIARWTTDSQQRFAELREPRRAELMSATWVAGWQEARP